MSKKLEGKKCPKFNAECTSGITYSNKDFDGKNLVIYFYPKDSTPGCTSEGQEFRDNYKQFKKNNTEILGVSRDTIKSHENFKEKQSFPFELLSEVQCGRACHKTVPGDARSLIETRADRAVVRRW